MGNSESSTPAAWHRGSSSTRYRVGRNTAPSSADDTVEPEQGTILYMSVSGSILGRQLIVNQLQNEGFEELEATGGQAAFRDDPARMDRFRRIVMDTARMLGLHVFDIVRMPDPGRGLFFDREDLARPANADRVTILYQDDPVVRPSQDELREDAERIRREFR